MNAQIEMEDKKHLGQLLHESGFVSLNEVKKALEIQQNRGGRIGSILLEMGACDEVAVMHGLLLQSPVITQSVARRRSRTRPYAGIGIATRPELTSAILILSDLLSLVLSLCIGVFLVSFIHPSLTFSSYAVFWPVLGLFIAKFTMNGLYARVPLNPVDELRNSVMSITFIHLALAAVTYLLQNTYSAEISRTLLLVNWGVSILAVPTARTLVRMLLASQKWWGYPVVVMGNSKHAFRIVEMLRKNPHLDLKPVAILTSDAERSGKVHGVPVLGNPSLATDLSERLKIGTAVIANEDGLDRNAVAFIDQYAHAFPHLLVIPNFNEFPSLHVSTQDLGGMLGLSLKQQLLLPIPRLLKRTMDLCFTITGGLLLLPFLLLVALLVKLDSKGPVLYTQPRLGKNGRRFKAYKFRTMHGDGEARLQALLDSDPDLREEYERFHKLRKDPRVTNIGKFLRKFSIDEFPQLLNVLKGDMSLVGPRPYLEREIPQMENRELVILKCVPGITGMWQVSTRNGSPFSHRITMDVYYVRNWSPWLDIYLLASTLKTVVKGTGS